MHHYVWFSQIGSHLYVYMHKCVCVYDFVLYMCVCTREHTVDACVQMSQLFIMEQFTLAQVLLTLFYACSLGGSAIPWSNPVFRFHFFWEKFTLWVIINITSLVIFIVIVLTYLIWQHSGAVWSPYCTQTFGT